jgi:hypothetical protein
MSPEASALRPSRYSLLEGDWATAIEAQSSINSINLANDMGGIIIFAICVYYWGQ